MPGPVYIHLEVKEITVPATCGVCGMLSLIVRPLETFGGIIESARCPRCRAQLSAGVIHEDQIHVEFEVTTRPA